jgi:ABC-2 type transport system permease protein
MESNWTDPFLFAIYSVIKPVAGALVLVFMYMVLLNPNVLASGDQPARELFTFMYIGNAFFIFVAQVLFGAFSVIQGDREWYQTIRYMYISPMSYYVYMLGRMAIKILIAAIAVVVTLAFGIFVLRLPTGEPAVAMSVNLGDVPYLAAAMVLGLLCVLAIGAWLGSITFFTARHVHGLTESVPAIFYLFSGVLYPLGVFEAAGASWAVGIGKAIPLTYWFETVRRSLMPPFSEGLSEATTLAGLSQPAVLAILAVSTALFFLLSVGTFRLTEWLARKAGKIDMLATY